MIKLTDLKDWSNRPYLDENPEYSKQLVATLNQIDGFSYNQLGFIGFIADSSYWTYDYSFSANFKINKEAFSISNGRICIRSLNRDDLLNPHYYQQLNDLANNYHSVEEWRWSYFAQDQVLQLEVLYWRKAHLNIKLTKAIDQYHQNQLNAMGKLITNVYDLIIKDHELDWKQFADQWKQEFDLDNIRSVGIVFDLNDFTNPKLLIRWKDENSNNRYENNDLKQVLKSDSELLNYLNQFKNYDQLMINQVDQNEQVNAIDEQIETSSINNDFQQLNQSLDANLYLGAKGKTIIAALNNLCKNIKVIIQYDDSIKDWFLSDLKMIHQEEQAIYTISGKLNIVIN